MGRLLVIAVFVVCFIVFAFIKLVIIGTKGAYQAVFDPHAQDKAKMELVSDVMLRISHLMHENYSGDPSELPDAIAALTPMVQEYMRTKGYDLSPEACRELIQMTIIEYGHATYEEVASA